MNIFSSNVHIHLTPVPTCYRGYEKTYCDCAVTGVAAVGFRGPGTDLRPFAHQLPAKLYELGVRRKRCGRNLSDPDNDQRLPDNRVHHLHAGLGKFIQFRHHPCDLPGHQFLS